MDQPPRNSAAEAVETLRRFVVRAVHIETHSLVVDRERLSRDALGTMVARFGLDGSTHVERGFPDEERMESLASRVRPLTLSEEPIHHKKVMNAIDVLLRSDGGTPNSVHIQRIASLRQTWLKYSLDRDSEVGYWHSWAPADGSRPPVEVTDVQLAAGWFYSDVAHANPDAWKAEALSFSRAHRFEAAVSRFSMLAIAALQTLDFVRELQGAGLVSIPEAAFEPDLATTRDVPEQTVLMVAPASTPSPGPVGTAVGAEWVRMNVGEAARLMPGNRVDVVLAKDGHEVLRRPGAIIARDQPDEHTFGMDVLVDEAIVFHLVANTEDATRSGLRTDTVWRTNRALSDGSRLLDRLHGSDTLTIVWNDRDIFRFAIESTGDAGYGYATADYAEDVAAIEDLAGVRLPPICEVPGVNRRAEIRVARLAMQGELVDGLRSPVQVTVPGGGPPQAVLLGIPPLTVGEIEIPLGPLLMWHPQAHTAAIDEPNRYIVSVPPGEAFRVWNPKARNMLPESDFTPTATIAANASPHKEPSHTGPPDPALQGQEASVPRPETFRG